VNRALIDLLRGEPLRVPSHALLVHFPAALLPAGVLLDLLDLALQRPALGEAAVLLYGLGLLAGVGAAGTGLLDWLEMIPGSRRRQRATRHLIIQGGALVAFLVIFVLRLGGPVAPASLVLGLAATGALFVGDHLGGLLVYEDGMRVRSGRRS
jgi:uncharacterized membrane protein